jgi:hypothetical protein
LNFAAESKIASSHQQCTQRNESKYDFSHL